MHSIQHGTWSHKSSELLAFLRLDRRYDRMGMHGHVRWNNQILRSANQPFAASIFFPLPKMLSQLNWRKTAWLIWSLSSIWILNWLFIRQESFGFQTTSEPARLMPLFSRHILKLNQLSELQIWSIAMHPTICVLLESAIWTFPTKCTEERVKKCEENRANSILITYRNLIIVHNLII